MDGTILITSGFGVAVGIAVIAILLNKQKGIFKALKLSILFFALDWIILSAVLCLMDDFPKWEISLGEFKFGLFGPFIWIVLFLGQIFLLIGFYLSNVALGKEDISEAGADQINNNSEVGADQTNNNSGAVS